MKNLDKAEPERPTFGREREVQEGSGRLKEVQGGSERFGEAQGGSGRLREAQREVYLIRFIYFEFLNEKVPIVKRLMPLEKP